jgi:hypothetical protein
VLDVLFGGLKVFLLKLGCPLWRPREKKIAIFDQNKIAFGHQHPGSGSASGFNLNAGSGSLSRFNEFGSATLENTVHFCLK